MRSKCTELTTLTKIVDILLGYKMYVVYFEGSITFLNLQRRLCDLPLLATIILGPIHSRTNVDMSDRCTTKRGPSITARHNVVIYMAHCTWKFIVNKPTFICQPSAHPYNPQG